MTTKPPSSMTKTRYSTINTLIMEHLLKCKTTYHLCNWYSGDYLYTLAPIISYLTRHLVTPDIITLLELYTFLHIKLNRPGGYYSHVRAAESHLKQHPHHQQRTPEWFAFREDRITGSEAAHFIGLAGPSALLNSFKGKIGLPCSRPNPDAPAIQHGTNYECVAKRVYELRYNVTVLELGCIASGDIPHIGASPDGIVFKTSSPITDTTVEEWTRYGRMIEIKCPYTRQIDATIKPEYEIQMLHQQFTCKLPICDFIECGIIDADHKGVAGVAAYISLDNMLADKFNPATNAPAAAYNRNIPIANLTANGYEKGVLAIVTFNTGKSTQILYPLETAYTIHDIHKWIIAIKTQHAGGRVLIKYWKMYNWSIKTVIYNQQRYEHDIIPQLNIIWKNVEIFRNLEATAKLLHIQSITNATSLITGIYSPAAAIISLSSDAEPDYADEIDTIWHDCDYDYNIAASSSHSYPNMPPPAIQLANIRDVPAHKLVANAKPQHKKSAAPCSTLQNTELIDKLLNKFV